MHDHSAASRRNGQQGSSPPTSGGTGDDCVDDDLLRARDGDQEAFARLYDRHAAVVLSICRARLVRAAPSEVDDACQETFIRAFGRLDQLEARGVFRSWLYAIARRVCSERARASRRRLRHEATAMMTTTAERLDSGERGRSPIERREAIEDLGEAIGRLEEREQLAIHLYYLDANPAAAAQSSLGLSRSAYYKLLARARARLAAMLRDHEPIQ